ncbi:MAG: response regulator, partial [Bacteroidota bacterium]
MNPVKAIIIDDEEHNRNVLKTLLDRHCRGIEVIAEANSADDGFRKISTLHPQLIFLDIKMPSKSGFDLLKMFDEINFEVIF